MSIIEDVESEVRYYARIFPDVFVTAREATLTSRSGKSYIDFFAGAGTLNYGHNDQRMKQALIDYLMGDGIVHSLDMMSGAKEAFLETFRDVILAPRGMDHRVLFPGPTGTNAVEAALKLARKATGRRTIVSFRGAFHGMTAGSLAVSRGPQEPSAPLPAVGDTVFFGFNKPPDTLCDYLEGPEKPAACIVETIQAEGGVVVADLDWLRSLRDICTRYNVAMIVDDIQVGCGRTGTFFSFEAAGIKPDIICLSKSLSGMGLPMAAVLVRPTFDSLTPGEHTGTFRGFVPAFVTAREALRYWRDDAFSRGIHRKTAIARDALDGLAGAFPAILRKPVRGRGLIQGLETRSNETARQISAEAFRRGLLIETAGRKGEVLKLLCPLTIADNDLVAGLTILSKAAAAIG